MQTATVGVLELRADRGAATKYGREQRKGLLATVRILVAPWCLEIEAIPVQGEPLVFLTRRGVGKTGVHCQVGRAVIIRIAAHTFSDGGHRDGLRKIGHTRHARCAQGIGRRHGERDRSVDAALRRRRYGVVAECTTTDRRTADRVAASDRGDNNTGFIAHHPTGWQRVDLDAGQAFAAIGIGQSDALQELHRAVFSGGNGVDFHVTGDWCDIQVKRHGVGLGQCRHRRIGVRILGAEFHRNSVEVTTEIGGTFNRNGREAALRRFQSIARGAVENCVGRAGGNCDAVNINRSVTCRIADDDVPPFAAVEILEGGRQ